MHLHFDVMYFPHTRDQSRTEYAIKMRNMLDQSYEVAHDDLQIVHKRTKYYYNRRTCNSRFKLKESVYLNKQVLKNKRRYTTLQIVITIVIYNKATFGTLPVSGGGGRILIGCNNELIRTRQPIKM